MRDLVDSVGTVEEMERKDHLRMDNKDPTNVLEIEPPLLLFFALHFFVFIGLVCFGYFGCLKGRSGCNHKRVLLFCVRRFAFFFLIAYFAVSYYSLLTGGFMEFMFLSCFD
jgi:hypothetical protein